MGYPVPMKDRNRKPPVSFRQRTIGGLLTAALAVIAVAILITQSRYDPGRWQAPANDIQKGGSDLPAIPTAPANTGNTVDTARDAAQDVENPPQAWDQVAGLTPLNAPERYDAFTLSDKINGKAELYLSAGFQMLETRRLGYSDHPALWLERYIYTMDSYNDAFSVFSRQRRPGASASAITGDAYRSANGLFLVHGPFYIEFIASDKSDAIWPSMAALAKSFVDHHPVSQSQRQESTFFPQSGLVGDSMALTTANAFGFSRLDQVYSAQYQWQDVKATAFVSQRQNPAQAAELARAYADFLVEYDAKALSAPPSDAPMYVLDVFGTFEIVFHQGAFFAGVHEAEELERGMALARQLRDNLKGAAP